MPRGILYFSTKLRMHLYRHSDWYAFSEEIPSGYSSQLPDFLYYHPAHLQSKNLAPLRSFFLLSIPNKVCLARIGFVRQGEEAFSLPMSSYAGLIGTEGIPQEVLRDFFFLDERLTKRCRYKKGALDTNSCFVGWFMSR